ncbi:MAG: hypothetical protein NXI27_04540 [Alphaproteobacteria bacterium]|nr:hypothetical protein [Alphaproteobacteria bacterium]
MIVAALLAVTALTVNGFAPTGVNADLAINSVISLQNITLFLPGTKPAGQRIAADGCCDQKSGGQLLCNPFYFNGGAFCTDIHRRASVKPIGRRQIQKPSNGPVCFPCGLRCAVCRATT